MSALWNGILDALGQILAFLYKVVPNYGVAIILLTILVRIVLLPLFIKQIRSQQAMAAVGPKAAELKKKYKNDRQKLNEETMKLYREHGVSPVSGCLPILATFPVLIALFAVLRVTGGSISSHIPRDSELFSAIKTQDTYLFPGGQMNLLCPATQAGRQVPFNVPAPFETNAPNYVGFGPNPRTLDCGSNVPDRIPYYLLAAAMIGTTFYQQRQMQRFSPAGSQQQQAITRIMPLVFGIWGFLFPAGLVLYWTTTNLVQIGQQSVMFRLGMIGGNPAGGATPKKPPGDGQTKRQLPPSKPKPAGGGSGGARRSTNPTRKPSSGGSGTQPSAGSGQSSGRQNGGPGSGEGRGQPPGGTSGGDRKKRRKR